jgi:hypothetical protein
MVSYQNCYSNKSKTRVFLYKKKNPAEIKYLIVQEELMAVEERKKLKSFSIDIITSGSVRNPAGICLFTMCFCFKFF